MKKVRYVANLGALKVNAQEVALLEKDRQKSLFENMLNQGLKVRYGMIGGSKARSLNRLLEQLDFTEDEYLVCETSEYELLKEAFCGEEAKFEPAQTRLIAQYIHFIETAEDLAAKVE